MMGEVVVMSCYALTGLCAESRVGNSAYENSDQFKTMIA